MIRKFVVDFAISFQDFFLSFFDATNDLFVTLIFLKQGINYKKIFAMLDVLNGQRIEITFAVGQMIYGIEDVCFSNPVFSPRLFRSAFSPARTG